MSKPRLSYFDFAGGRGEECRIALHLADIVFDDERVKSADWPAQKERMPFAAMPVLQIPGKPPLAHCIHVICRSGGRAYDATRILLQNGFKARTLAGGMLSRTHASTFWSDETDRLATRPSAHRLLARSPPEAAIRT